MKLFTISFVTLTSFVAVAAPAAAQNHYVGASLAGDIARFGRADVSPATLIAPTDESRDGEALGLGVSAGTALGDRWGIEIEFVRPARIESTITQRFPVTLPAIPVPSPIPSFEFEIASSERHTTLTASAWIRQEINERFALAYLAGVTFSRTELEQSVDIGVLRSLVPLPAARVDVVEYGTGPAIGIEGRVKLWEHVAIVPGMKVHTVKLSGTSGWLLRPAIAARWVF